MAGNTRVAGMPWWLRNRGVMVLLDIIEYYYLSIFYRDNVWYIIIIFPNLISYSTIHQPTPKGVTQESWQNRSLLPQKRNAFWMHMDHIVFQAQNIKLDQIWS